jgi:hypothetical protein
VAIPKPDPRDWQIANAQELRATDREVLAMLRDTRKRVDAELAALIALNRSNISDGVKRARLEQSRIVLMREQAATFERLGEITEARRLRAAVRAQRLSAAADAALLKLVGRSADAQTLYDAALQSSQRAVDVALQRMRFSAVPLSQRIYNTGVWMNGRLQKLINETLGTNINAREFARRARDWFNPNTPGGVRYAAMRLARTEINNAFHSMTVEKAAGKPWVEEMEWNLSKSHPAPDICNKVAELSPYKADKVPARPHPQCMCYVTEKEVDEDEWIDRFVAGEFDDYLDDELEKAGVPKDPTPPPTPELTPPVRRRMPPPVLLPEDDEPEPKRTPSGKQPKPKAKIKDFIPLPKGRSTGEKIQIMLRDEKSREEIRKAIPLPDETVDKLIDVLLKKFKVPPFLMDRKETPDEPKRDVKNPPRVFTPRREPDPPTPAPVVRTPAARVTAGEPLAVLKNEITGPKSAALKKAESRISKTGFAAETLDSIKKVFAHQEKFIGDKILRVKQVKHGIKDKEFKGAFALHTGGVIEIRDSIATPESQQAIKNCVQSEWFVKCDHHHGGTEQIFAHEMGHALLTMNSANKFQAEVLAQALGEAFGVEPPKLGPPTNGLAAGYHPYFDEWLAQPEIQRIVSNKVSDYATRNINEFIAEVWTLYTMNKSPNQSVIRIARAIQEKILKEQVNR